MRGTCGRSGVMLAVGTVLGMLVGSHLYTPAHAGSDPCTAPARVGGSVLFSAKGDSLDEQKFDTKSFVASSTFTVAYSLSPAQGMGQFNVGSLSVLIKNNSYGVDLITVGVISGGGTKKKGTVVESHLDCTKGCYFSIDAKSVSWTLKVTH